MAKPIARKKTLFCTAFAAALSTLAGSAHAQSSVTLYGVADASVRYLTGADKANDSLVSLANGAISQSRWGLRGIEDLGGGWHATFKLESGFNLTNGALSSANTVFNRYAAVGIGSNTFGTVTLGQQNNPVYEFLIDGWDPLTVGNYFQNEWAPVAFSGTLHGGNNMAMYTYGRGQLLARAAYSFGNVVGNTDASSLKSVALTYGPDPLGAEIGFVQAANVNGLKQTTFNVHLRYQLQPAEFWLGYYYSNDHTGLVEAFLSGNAPAPSSNTPRKDNVFVAGASYRVMPQFKLTGAAYYDSSRDVANQSGDAGNGKRYTLVGLAEYFLSKRVTVYGTVDYNRMSGAARAEAPNGKDQFGAGAGMRMLF